MANCTPTNRNELLANFGAVPGDMTSNLRTLILGVDYAARRFDAAAGTNFVGAYSAGAGVSSPWPDLQAGETVDQAQASVWVVDGLVNYYADILPVAASDGLQNGTAPNEIVHNAGATIFAGANRTVAIPTDVVVGDVVILNDGVGGTLTTTVTGFKYTLGEPNILVLADNLPAALLSPTNFLVSLSEVVAETELTAAQTTLSTTTVAADAAITLSTSRTGSAFALIGATGYSDVYVNYRAARTPGTVGEMLSITDRAQLPSLFVGWEYPESGLGFAVARALAPVQTPNRALPAVLAMAVVSELTASWSAAFARVQRRRDWLSLAVLTADTAVQALAVAMVEARAAIGLDSRIFLSLELTLEETLVSGAGNTVLVDQSLTAGFNRTVTRDGGIAAPFAGVVAGDIVQIAGTDYPVATVVSNQTVTIASSASAGAGQVLNNVRHVLTPEGQATDYGTRAQAFASGAVSVIFPPSPTWNDQLVDGFLLAAAAAGLRGYTMPQQGLRSVLMESEWAVPQSAYEFYPYLPTLGSYGVFVFDELEPVPSGVVVLYPNTTDQSETIVAREGLQANVAAIKRYLQDQVQCLIGRVRVISPTLDAIRVDVLQAVARLRNTSVAPFGPMLVTGTVGTPVQNATLRDQVDIPVALTISAGLEQVVLDIVVTIEGA